VRQSRLTETEIVYAVKQVELDVAVREIARKCGMSDKTIYLWRREYDEQPLERCCSRTRSMLQKPDGCEEHEKRVPS